MRTTEKPIGGTDYPRTFNEFEFFFMDEPKCREYIIRVRWPDGYVCPQCGSNKTPWRTNRGGFRCQKCDREMSVTAGTLFERSKFPLKTWFLAIWFVTSQKNGANALGLQRVLGLGSYQTAWTWLHKLRRAMVRPGRDRLHGNVEVDESFIGGISTGGKRGRGAENKEIVVIVVEIHEPKGFGRIRMKRIDNASTDSLSTFITEVVEPGSTILTDAWAGYNELEKLGYKHIKSNLSDSGDPAHVVMPGVHRIASLLKRWILGTHQGAVSKKYLDYYLDEYTFRFNRRSSLSRGLLFYRLMQHAVTMQPISYKQIVENQEHNI
ncbi:MAG: IS1595 family transposase [Methylococcaceae bacterium]